MIKEYLTFDDVNIVPRYSEIQSRSDCSTLSRLSKNYMLEVPVIAAPMDTVCDSKMAIALWELGACGIIHRFMNIYDQVREVDQLRDHISRTVITLQGPGTLRYTDPVIAAAVGVTDNFIDRVIGLTIAGANVILIDVAHGDHRNVKTAIEQISAYRKESRRQFDIIAGNVATLEGARNLMKWKADGIRVGIGGGSVCETRIRTGVGVPQVSAVESLRDIDLPIISDGGIRYIGDVAKAIVSGADTVMVGSLFAGTDEAPGEIHTSGQWPNKIQHKLFRGSASESIKIANGTERRNIEGTAKMVPLKGCVSDIINDIIDGLRSAMSYVGAQNIEELKRAELIRVSPAGMAEGLPHLLKGA